MHDSCLAFVSKALSGVELAQAAVIEVGAYDHNGSVRSVFGQRPVGSYLGVDISEGPGVDEVCSVHELSQRYGRESFDLVLSTELMEHVDDWRGAIREMKAVTKVGGLLIITTRSKGFSYHGYPFDFWRYIPEDMARIFAGWEIELLEADPEQPGVFLKAKKTSAPDVDLAGIALFSILRGARILEHVERDHTRCAKMEPWEREFLDKPMHTRLYRRYVRRPWRKLEKALKRWRSGASPA